MAPAPGSARHGTARHGTAWRGVAGGLGVKNTMLFLMFLGIVDKSFILLSGCEGF